MRRSTLLISRQIIDEHPQLLDWSGNDFRNVLNILMRDPMLHEKIRLLKSDQYTKIYQDSGQDLQWFKFYPFPEDWCQLSILSNGTGFSRCYIFVYLLKYFLGLLKLKSGPTVQKFCLNLSNTPYVFCKVAVQRIEKKLRRQLKIEKSTDGS